jgi:hypothetical protein
MRSSALEVMGDFDHFPGFIFESSSECILQSFDLMFRKILDLFPGEFLFEEFKEFVLPVQLL